MSVQSCKAPRTLRCRRFGALLCSINSQRPNAQIYLVTAEAIESDEELPEEQARKKFEGVEMDEMRLLGRLYAAANKRSFSKKVSMIGFRT